MAFPDSAEDLWSQTIADTTYWFDFRHQFWEFHFEHHGFQPGNDSFDPRHLKRNRKEPVSPYWYQTMSYTVTQWFPGLLLPLRFPNGYWINRFVHKSMVCTNHRSTVVLTTVSHYCMGLPCHKVLSPTYSQAFQCNVVTYTATGKAVTTTLYCFNSDAALLDYIPYHLWHCRYYMY